MAVKELKSRLVDLDISERDYNRIRAFENALKHPVRANDKTYVEVPEKPVMNHENRSVGNRK